MNDILSDVLRAVRLTGAIFFSVDATAPWATTAPPARALGPMIRPGVDHVIEFHAIVSGTCWGGLLDEPPIALRAGDLFVLPHGDSHTLSSAADLRGDLMRVSMDPTRRPAMPMPLTLGGASGEKARFICGFLGCDARPFNPLLSTLPRMIHVPGAATHVPLLAQLIELAVAESRSPGAGRESMLARLSELMFVAAMRHYVAASPRTDQGWLAGLSDDLLGRALSVLHGRPSHAWTLDLLAKEIGSSRSVLADRFASVLGMPPMQYLAQWRMQLASEMLTTTSAGLGEIASRVGYGSETALSHAFKRMVGVSPTRFRSGERSDSVAV